MHGEEVAGYTAEPGIALDSPNDTYIAARLEVDDPFWKDIPIYIRTDKRLKKKSTRIVIEFKSEDPLKDLLNVEIGPNEGISFRRSHSGIEGFDVDKIVQISAIKDGVPEAYEILIHDCKPGFKVQTAELIERLSAISGK